MELHEAILFAGSYCTLTPRFLIEVKLILPHEKETTMVKETMDVNKKEMKDKKRVMNYMRIYLKDDLNDNSNKMEPVLNQFTQSSKHHGHHHNITSRLLYKGSLEYIKNKNHHCNVVIRILQLIK